jgi:hypothetical protein
MPQLENCTITTSSSGRVYFVKANAGYLLHDREIDIVEIDNFTNEEISRTPGYTSATCSVPVSYDWEANPREFYAVPRDSVPADQIFGGGGNHVTQ